MNFARALLKTLQAFEEVSGLKLSVRKTEAMGIGSLQNCEDEPLGVRWQKCVKFLGIFITYDVKQLLERKKSKEKTSFWKLYLGGLLRELRGLFLHKCTMI